MNRFPLIAIIQLQVNVCVEENMVPTLALVMFVLDSDWWWFGTGFYGALRARKGKGV